MSSKTVDKEDELNHFVNLYAEISWDLKRPRPTGIKAIDDYEESYKNSLKAQA